VNDSLAAIGVEDGGEIVAVQDQEGGCGVVTAS
jgi:hypothetical protein